MSPRPLISPGARGLLAGALLCSACGSEPSVGSPDAGPPDASVPRTESDIRSTGLAVDVTARTATATLALVPPEDGVVTLEIGDLAVTAVRGGSGPLVWHDLGDRLEVTVPGAPPLSDEPVTVAIDYGYQLHDGFEGVRSDGLTFTWPYYCGNVFPCLSRSTPADGTTFTQALSGVPDGMQAVYPASVPADAPPYQLAWAVGAYQHLELGETAAGTKVGVWFHPGGDAIATEGTANLRAVFDWYESHLGPYLYGGEVGSVAATWGPGAYGGMEHHPLWHVATGSMASQETHAHEAAHGWFGDGIRIRCWEDFVLSEGTVTYLAARSLEAVGGAALGQQIWTSYDQRLQLLIDAGGGVVAWPASCGAVDVLDLFNDSPYIKGAYFLRAVEERIGREALDRVLAAFYQTHRGRSAGMQDLLDAIAADGAWDPAACADRWLRQPAVPADRSCN